MQPTSMPRQWLASHKVSLFILVVGLSFVPASGTDTNQKGLVADGVVARAGSVIVFARLGGCGGPYQRVQMIVSTDNGQTWTPRGPLLEGSDYRFVLDTGTELWIAGEGFAEGPTHNPFLVRYADEEADARVMEIYNGGSELLSLALETKTGKLLAWVRHLESTVDTEKGPIYLHMSADRGRTWSEADRVRRVPMASSGLRFFQDLPRRSGIWRISGNDSVLERRQSSGKWQREAGVAVTPCTN